MIYLFYGTEIFLINKKIDEIQNNNNIDSINFNKYDLESTLLEDIIEDAETISLFSDKKMILVENAYIFTSSTNKKLLEQKIELLDAYLTHINPDTILIFSINKEKLDERKKIVKKIKELGTVAEYNNEFDIKKTLVTMIEPYKMDNKTLDLLVSRVGNDLMILNQEIEKIKLFKEDNVTITEQDILKLTSKNVDTDIFNLIENIVNHNLEDAMESYKEMIKRGEEPIKIIIMLANQFRLIYQAKILYKKGYSEKNIASELEIHPYRIKLALQKGRSFSEGFLLSCLEKLADIDSDIKHGKIDKELGLELFLLQT